MPRRQSQSVHGAMNRQRDHHRQGKLAKVMRGRLIKMTGGARRADVKDVAGDDGKKEITRACSRQKLPPPQRFQTFRNNAANRNAQQSSRPETDEGAKLLMRPDQ